MKAPTPALPWEGLKTPGFEERLAVLTSSLAKDRAAGLLDGVSHLQRDEVRGHLERMQRFSSSDRQSRLAVTFAPRPDAAANLQLLASSVGPEMREEMLRILPSYHRSAFPDLDEARAAVPEPRRALLVSLAHRWVREASH